MLQLKAKILHKKMEKTPTNLVPEEGFEPPTRGL